VGEPERELELALAYLSELRRFRLSPYDAGIVARATYHAQRAHRLIFRARWAAA